MAEIPYLLGGLVTCLLAGSYLNLRQRADRLRQIRADLILGRPPRRPAIRD